ncbi:PAS domain S-box protein [Marinifilum caeruleilacunae]|uniref:histidine kinase n=1 Tax=Marinifilum caeruleilacunae TaxID=2499076 RepID=A0ABX1X0X7_9BACT|nr:PAS domain S-box protein [Marinifilum caeruleilacunae]NOU62052.1 PAS domain S-box protein [Marinifilum caeruleilacunae]
MKFIQNSFYKELLHNSGAAMFLFDVDGKIIDANKAACDGLGYSREELLEKSVPDIDVNFSRKELVLKIYDKLSKNKSETIYSEHLRKDGTSLKVEVQLSLIEWEKEEIVFGIVRDLSELEKTKEQLSIHVTTLEKLNEIIRSKDELTLRMRNVLQLILGVFKLDRCYLIPSSKIEKQLLSLPIECSSCRCKSIFTAGNFEQIRKEIESNYKGEYRNGSVDFNFELLQSTGEYCNEESQIEEFVVELEEEGVYTYLLGIQRCSSMEDWSYFDKRLFTDILARLKDALRIYTYNVHLEDRETKYRLLYDNAPLSYQSLNIDGNFIDVNETWLNVLGYEREEIIGSSYADLLHEDWKAHFEKNFPLFKARGYVHDVQFKIRHKKGHYLDISFEGCVGYHPDGSFRQTYCVFQDITLKKKAEEEIEKFNQRFRTFVERVPIPLCHVNFATGELLYMNQKFKDLFGYSLEDIPNIEDWWPKAYPDKEYRAWVMDNWAKAVEYGKENNTDITPDMYNVTCKDGNEKQVIISGVVLGEDFLASFVDLTAQKVAEKELLTAKERAEESEKLKTAFLANMSHEIRTPMNGILGFADLLKSPKLSGEKQQKYIDIIHESGERMLSTINDIIEISKIETNQIEPIFSEVNVNESLEHYYHFFKPEAKSKQLSFTYAGMERHKDMLILADQAMLDSIVTNLLKNAIKYTHKGEIEFGCEELEGFLKFYVRDTGIGIPKEMHKYVFDRFRQVKVENEKAIEGSGLGLSIVKAYVEMLGGSICLDSSEGEGSEFIFTLPLRKIPVIDKKGSKMLGTNSEINKKLKILLAEDDESTRMYMSIILEDITHELLLAKNGEIAVEMFKQNSDIDLVLMDMKMPIMDGYKATEMIREMNKDVPIIAQTAFALIGDRDKTLNAGCTEFITKPVKAEELKELIGKVV